MKKLFMFGLLLFVIGLVMGCGGTADQGTPAAEPASTPAPPPAAAPGRGLASATVAGHQVSIDYGRPQLKGRDMLSQLPDGQVWRFGQNEATGFQTATDLQFGETSVAAGSYTLFVRKVSADQWNLIFSRQTGQWGTDYDSSQDAYEVPLTASKSDEKVETFTIELEGGESAGRMIASWDTLTLTAEFRVAG